MFPSPCVELEGSCVLKPEQKKQVFVHKVLSLTRATEEKDTILKAEGAASTKDGSAGATDTPNANVSKSPTAKGVTAMRDSETKTTVFLPCARLKLPFATTCLQRSLTLPVLSKQSICHLRGGAMIQDHLRLRDSYSSHAGEHGAHPVYD